MKIFFLNVGIGANNSLEIKKEKEYLYMYMYISMLRKQPLGGDRQSPLKSEVTGKARLQLTGKKMNKCSRISHTALSKGKIGINNNI